MKIFRLITIGAVALSGYIGYENFGDIKSVISEDKVERSIEGSHKSVKNKMSKEEERDYVDIAIKIGETILPLLAPVFLRKRRKTLDDEISDVADQLGLPKSVVRGKLGLGDKRKRQTGTVKRRKTD